jgi:hypothetical protein
MFQQRSEHLDQLLWTEFTGIPSQEVSPILWAATQTRVGTGQSDRAQLKPLRGAYLAMTVQAA